MAITLRLPEDLHQDLHRIADRDYRTLTAQITLALRRFVEEDQRQQEQAEQGASTPPRARR